MGVPERAAIYENCSSHNPHWAPDTPMTATRSEPQPQQQQQQQQQFDRVLPPPPYPGHSKQIFSNMPGFRQSYSGSDTSTDMSLSSTENLAAWPRQEPQWEEVAHTSLPHPSLDDGSFSVLSRLQGGSCTAASLNDSMERLSASPGYAAGTSSSFSSCGHSQSASATSTSSGGDDLSSSGGSRSAQPRMAVPHAWQVSPGVPPPHSGRYFHSQTPTYHHPHPYVNQNWTVGERGGAVSELCGGQGCSQVVTYVPFLPPPPEYPGHRKDGAPPRPCGRKVGQGRCLSDPVRSFDAGAYRGLLKDCGVSVGPGGSYVNSDTIFSALKPGSPKCLSGSPGSAKQVINILNEDNRRLQEELVQCYKKISKLQKLEQEIQHVQEAYQSLVRSTEKRERLEAVIKGRLQDEVKKLQTTNDELKGQVQKAGSSRKMRSRSEGRGSGQRERESVASLKQLLCEKHSHVEQLESHVEQWEQRYRELQAAQFAPRQTAESSWCDYPPVATVNSPLVAHRQDDKAQSDKLQATEDLVQSQRRVAELETRVAWLQDRLGEKQEAMTAHSHLSQSLPEVSSLPDPHPRPSRSMDHTDHGQSPAAGTAQGGQGSVQLWQV